MVIYVWQIDFDVSNCDDIFVTDDESDHSEQPWLHYIVDKGKILFCVLFFLEEDEPCGEVVPFFIVCEISLWSLRDIDSFMEEVVVSYGYEVMMYECEDELRLFFELDLVKDRLGVNRFCQPKIFKIYVDHHFIISSRTLS